VAVLALPGRHESTTQGATGRPPPRCARSPTQPPTQPCLPAAGRGEPRRARRAPGGGRRQQPRGRRSWPRRQPDQVPHHPTGGAAAPCLGARLAGDAAAPTRGGSRAPRRPRWRSWWHDRAWRQRRGRPRPPAPPCCAWPATATCRLRRRAPAGACVGPGDLGGASESAARTAARGATQKKNPAATKNKRAPVPTRTTRWRCWQRPLAGARAPHDGHDGGFGTGGWGGHRPRRKAPPAAPFARGPTQPHDRCYRPAAEKTCSGGGESWAAPKSASGTAAMPAPSHHHDLPAQNLNDAMATLTVCRWRSQRPHAGARAPRCRHGGGYGLSGWGTTAEKPTRGARRAVRRPARRAKGLLLPAGGLRGTEFGETSAGGAGCGRLNCHRGQEDLCWAVGDGRAPRNWAALVRRADITGAAEPVVKTPGCNRQIETAAGLVG